MDESTLTAIDLFAGAGGATEGLRRAGFRIVAAVENDPAAASTYHANHPEVVPLFVDIQSVPIRPIRLALGLKRGALTLLKACPPCRGYSTLAGSHRDNPDNDLVADAWPWISEFRPSAFLLENVWGLRRDPRFARLVRRARGAGYRVGVYRIDAADFGVPQHRRRLIALGVRGPAKPPSNLLDELGDVLRPRRTAADVFAAAEGLDATVDPLHRGRNLSDAVLSRVRSIPVGGGRFDLPESLQLACHRAIEGRHATASYGRIRLDEPAPTMTTRCTTPACGRFIHPTENRGLTLREASLIQTFPPDYRFLGTYGQIERQIGNAVPVTLAEALGLVVRSMLRASGTAVS